MIVTCNVIGDLLPLYADGICSEDTKTVVEHHVAECPECRKKLEAMTAEMEKPPDQQKELEHSKLFRVLHKRYTKLGIITLLICAVILIPGAICFVLTVDDGAGSGVSWSTISAERQMRSVARLLKKGDYAEAADILLDNDAAKEMFVDDYSAFFESHKLESTEVSAAYNKNLGSSGDITGLVIFRFDDVHKSAIVLEFSFDRYAESMAFDCGGGEFDDGSDYEAAVGDDQKSLIAPEGIMGGYGLESFALMLEGMPRDYGLCVSGSGVSLGWLNDGGYSFTGTALHNSRQDDIYVEFLQGGDLDKWPEYKSRLDEFLTDEQQAYLMERLCREYGFVSAEGGEVYYQKTPDDPYYKGYPMQDFVFRFDGFSVSFTANVMYTIHIPVENISYSEGTPDSFKTDFEQLFVNSDGTSVTIPEQKLNDGKFYLNGDPDSCYYLVENGTIQLVIENEEQAREYYDLTFWSENFEIDEMCSQITEQWSEPKSFEILFNSWDGYVVAFNVARYGDNISGYSSIDYIDEDNIVSNDLTFTRINVG